MHYDVCISIIIGCSLSVPAGWRSPIYDFIAGRAVCHDGAAKPVHREKCGNRERERERETKFRARAHCCPSFSPSSRSRRGEEKKRKRTISVPILLLLLLLLFQMDIAKKSAFLSYSFFSFPFIRPSTDIEYSTEI